MERGEQRVRQGGWDGDRGRDEETEMDEGSKGERGLNYMKHLKLLVSEQSCIQENHNAGIRVYCNRPRKTVAYLTWSNSISQYRIA